MTEILRKTGQQTSRDRASNPHALADLMLFACTTLFFPGGLAHIRAAPRARKQICVVQDPPDWAKADLNAFFRRGVLLPVAPRGRHAGAWIRKQVEPFVNLIILHFATFLKCFLCKAKVLDENILLAIKLDKKQDYLYVASLYDVNTSKIERRLSGGRLKAYDKTCIGKQNHVDND